MRIKGGDEMKYLFALLFIGGLIFGMADAQNFGVFLASKFLAAGMLLGAGVVGIYMNIRGVE
jgi:hypothetical protein